MASGSNNKFNGQPFVFNRGRNVSVSDSTSYLLQPEMSPSPVQGCTVPLSPAYSYAGEMSPGSPYFPMQNGSGSHSFNSFPSCSEAGLPIYPIPERGLPVKVTGTQQSFRQESPLKYNMYHNKVYGVGDMEDVRIEGLNRGTKMYDYADMGHQYEELPGGRKSMMGKFPMDAGGDSRSEYQSSGGATDIVSEMGDATGIVNQSEKRKRVNPLYDHMAQSVPSIYNKVKNKGEKKLYKQVRCLRCIMIFLIFICCASIAISIFAVLNGQTKAEPAEISPTVAQLVANYSSLEKMYKSLSGILYTNDSTDTLSVLINKVMHVDQHTKAELEDIRKRLINSTAGMEANTDYISILQTNLTSELMSLNGSIQERLNTISKMQGPSGVGNLSMCMYENRTNSYPASETYPSFTLYAPTEMDLETYVVMFAACSTEGGTEAMLMTNVKAPSKVQYRCKCTGKVVIPENRRFCYLHFLRCPRYS